MDQMIKREEIRERTSTRENLLGDELFKPKSTKGDSVKTPGPPPGRGQLSPVGFGFRKKRGERFSKKKSLGQKKKKAAGPSNPNPSGVGGLSLLGGGGRSEAVQKSRKPPLRASEDLEGGRGGGSY